MMTTLYYPLIASETPRLCEVGGKALSLIRMSRWGFPVPPGIVLTVAFFEPWIDLIRQTPQWRKLRDDPKHAAKSDYAELRAYAVNLKLDHSHIERIAEALRTIEPDGSQRLYAVRSSSPEEDLEGASFAGVYESVLGVRKDDLIEALRRCFASSLAERVIVYKRTHGFSLDGSGIAIVVQEQVAADSAGVAFSLNPLNNCYDEAMINANFGLGESVVSGRASPDRYVIDKVSSAILEKRAGRKETSVHLLPAGGTCERSSTGVEELCLSDEQVLSITQTLTDLEARFDHPIDIEWAFGGEKLYLLQARPITAWFPLPDSMRTRPGEPRHLYVDYTLTKQGIRTPLSPLGMDYLDLFSREESRDLMGTATALRAEAGLVFNLEGRVYGSLSNSFKMQRKKEVIWELRTTDTISADILEGLDLAPYIPARLPRQLKGLMLKTVLHSLHTGWRTLEAIVGPERYHRFFREETRRFAEGIEHEERRPQSLSQFATVTVRQFVRYLNHVSLPVTLAAEFARWRIRTLFAKEPQEVRDRAIYLEQALPHNVTIDMGLAMYELAQFDEIRASASPGEFAARIAARSYSTEFLAAWDKFMKTHGHRCPKEMDVAAPRFREMPEYVYRQLRTLAENVGGDRNPQAVLSAGLTRRNREYEFLRRLARSRGKRAERRLRKNYRILVEFGGYREIHKYYLIRIIDMLRRRALAAGRAFSAEGRLDFPDQVFNLTIGDLDRGVADASLNLRSLAEKNSSYLRKLRHVREFPRIIDSRGRILRPPRREARPGELVGEPISPGVVRGQAKVLVSPDEKAIMPGEILVTRATDPGWTPLFLNAGGIVLEVGGLLQHGAVVAREYCKPCVAGINDATSLLEDGQTVELDGSKGTVTVIASQAVSAGRDDESMRVQSSR